MMVLRAILILIKAWFNRYAIVVTYEDISDDSRGVSGHINCLSFSGFTKFATIKLY